MAEANNSRLQDRTAISKPQASAFTNKEEECMQAEIQSMVAKQAKNKREKYCIGTCICITYQCHCLPCYGSNTLARDSVNHSELNYIGAETARAKDQK